jgi:hypothetical protein
VDIAVRYKYCGAYKYFGALHLDASLNGAVRYKYCGALHLDTSLGAWCYKYYGALQILRCAAP